MLLGAAIALPATECQASVFGFGADPDTFITSYQGFAWSGSGGAYSWVNGAIAAILDNPVPAPDAPLGYAWSNSAANLSMSSTVAFSINSVDVYADNAEWGTGLPTLPLTIDG